MHPRDMCECGWMLCSHRWAGLEKREARVCDSFRLKSTYAEYEAKRERHRRRMNYIHAAQLVAVAVLIAVSVFRAFHP